MKIFSRLFSLFSLFIPVFAFAQTLKANPTVGDILTFLAKLLGNTLIPVLFAIALIVFFWGIIRYITAAGEPEKIREGTQYIIWGIVGLFVMSAIWGIIGILTGTLGISKVVIPQLEGQ